MPFELDKTKCYTIKDSNPGKCCKLYFLENVGEYDEQESGWQFYLGFTPYVNSRDINWDDLPEWLQTAFLNNPGLIIEDYNPGE